MDIVERLRKHALPDPHDERDVMHAPLLREAADTIQQQAERIRELEIALEDSTVAAGQIAYLRHRIRALEADRDSWAEQASQRVQDWCDLNRQLSEVVEYALAKDAALMECAKVNSLDRPMHCQTIVNEAMALPLPKAMQG